MRVVTWLLLVVLVGFAGLATPAFAQSLPSGSYQQTCSGAYMRGNTLYATCADSNGRYKRTQLDISSCRGRDISNIGGQLSCKS